MPLYHADVFMPSNCRIPAFQGRLKYGHHAKTAALDDRYGHVTLPQMFDASRAEIIEAEVNNGKVVKQVWRQQLDSSRDLVLVITSDGFVKTVWVNLRSDKHKSLNRARYAHSD